MRFLKTKILRAQEAQQVKKTVELPSPTYKTQVEDLEHSPITTQPSTPTQDTAATEIASKLSQSRRKQTFGQKRQSQVRDPKGSTRATKNVVINFGKAISSFAVSPLAVPYLESILANEGLTNKEFNAFVGEAKGRIGGIDSFRSLVLITDADTVQLAACKRAFAQIGTVFIKYFSVNWITHGRVANKLIYLKYRNKVLRRIQKPELFTYISEGKRGC